MKITCPIFATLFFIACAGKSPDIPYIGSTPAGKEVREFLGIPQGDSIDFIRWYVVMESEHFHAYTNYGIGKPNTNGFMEGGKKIDITGQWEKKGNKYKLTKDGRSITLMQLNPSLLHCEDSEGKLIIGDGGWSYALNAENPKLSDELEMVSKQTSLPDSMTFNGRTPCGVDGVIKTEQCYKLKWSLVLYGNAARNEPAGYKIRGTGFRSTANPANARRGNWEIKKGKTDRIIYQLNDENGKGLFYLVKLDEGVLIFTDKDGKLLVGDKDFSYTLNRK